MTKGLLITPRFYFGGIDGTLKMLRKDGLKLASRHDNICIKHQCPSFLSRLTTSALVFSFWKNMMTKNMTVSYKPGTGYLGSKPMPYIRISNKFLQKYGFEHGDKIVVKYQRGKITITKHEQHNRS